MSITKSLEKLSSYTLTVLGKALSMIPKTVLLWESCVEKEELLAIYLDYAAEEVETPDC